MASQHDKDRIYKSDISTFELTRAQEASYPLPVNLLFKDFNYIVYKVAHNLKVEDQSNKRSGSANTWEGI